MLEQLQEEQEHGEALAMQLQHAERELQRAQQEAGRVHGGWGVSVGARRAAEWLDGLLFQGVVMS